MLSVHPSRPATSSLHRPACLLCSLQNVLCHWIFSLILPLKGPNKSHSSASPFVWTKCRLYSTWHIFTVLVLFLRHFFLELLAIILEGSGGVGNNDGGGGGVVTMVLVVMLMVTSYMSVAASDCTTVFYCCSAITDSYFGASQCVCVSLTVSLRQGVTSFLIQITYTAGD